MPHALPRTLTITKECGQTPLEALNVLRAKRPELALVPLAYAGRLDPMASGTLLVLVGETCKQQQKYHGLDKEYEAEVLLGVATDTGDTLGLPTLARHASKCTSIAEVRAVLPQLVGSFELPYPAFSSKVVDGQPLFLRSLNGSIRDITIPTHTETVHTLKLLSTQTLSTQMLIKRIKNDLAQVPRSNDPRKTLGADFRQDAIRDAWCTELASVAKNHPERQWQVLGIRATVGSGTYIRTLAARIAHALGTSGIALSIHRTRMGRYRSFGRWGVWTKNYR